MKISLDEVTVTLARSGDLGALERLLQEIQQPVYNLAVRMLGHREDAEDATQEVLLKVTTHLATWRGESAFGTWVYTVASNHLLNAKTRAVEPPKVSFDVFAEHLEQGLTFAASPLSAQVAPSTVEASVDARRTALSCTQAMLLCLDREQRLAYVLDMLFGLESDEAATVQQISAAAHRKRLSRARQALEVFMTARCGLVNAEASCRCKTQVPAKRWAAARGVPTLEVSENELDAAAEGLRQLTVMGDAVAVLRGAPVYQQRKDFVQSIRLIVDQSSFIRH